MLLFLTVAQDLFNVLFDLYAGQHDLMPAFLAADLEIHAYTQYVEPVRTAGVRLFCLDHISDPNIHTFTTRFIILMVLLYTIPAFLQISGSAAAYS